MRKATLVVRTSLGLWLLAMVAMLGICHPAQAGTFGSVIQLPGHISEIVLDEPRGVLYAADFTTGQVDVISTATNRLISSINVGRSPSGLAISPDGQYLVVTNYNNLGVPTISSVTVVNLNDLSRQNYAISNPPLAVAFGADGLALIITTVDIQRFRPSGGTFELVTTIASLGEALPVVAPKFPREITRASMTASGDGNSIFGLSESFVFVYQVPSPGAVLNVRLLTTLIHPLAPPVVTASFDGSYFMAGQYLMDRRLRVMAEYPDSQTSDQNIGGHVIDFGLRSVFAAYAEPIAGAATTTTTTTTTTGTTTTTTGGTGTTTGGTTTATVATLLPPRLLVQDADNLTTRDRLQLAERITGRMVLAGGGRSIYALSESGILYLPLSDVPKLAQVRPNTEQVFIQFDFCQKSSQRQQIRIEGNADFQLSSTLKGVSFSPASGTAPAAVEVIVDFQEYSKVQGTTHGKILVTSQNAINQVNPIALAINVKDADQRGRLVPVPGELIDILPDPRRDQFYVLEQTKNEVHAFQNSDLRLLGTFKTGNRPTWMTLSADRRYLLVANSAGENLTVVNLDSMQSEGYLFMPPGDNPISVAADNSTTLVAVRTADGTARLDKVEVTRRDAQALGNLGVYANQVHNNTAMVPLANLSGIFIAEADGNVKLWDAAGQDVVLARKLFPSLKGAVAAGPNALVAENNILSLALVPQGVLGTDTPNVPAGFTFMGEVGIRTTGLSGAVTDTGTVQRFDVRTPGIRRSPVRLVEAPLTPIKFPFLRSLAGLRSGTIISTSTTGLVELPGNFDASVAIPRVTAITSAADFSDALAPGSLVTIFGQNLAGDTIAAGSLPLPTSLADICVTVNGVRLPLLYVSPGQINGQLPFEVSGRASTVLHTPGGLSDTYYPNVQTTAPAVFQINVSGQQGTFPAIVRVKNNQLTTLANPLRPNEMFVVYATGLGEVGPPVETGAPGPSSPLAVSRTTLQVTLGDKPVGVAYAGLAPGLVGVYQLNLLAPGDVPLGLQIPLTISTGSASTTVNVRVVD